MCPVFRAPGKEYRGVSVDVKELTTICASATYCAGGPLGSLRLGRTPMTLSTLSLVACPRTTWRLLRQHCPVDWTDTVFLVVIFHPMETGSQAWQGGEIGVLGARPYSYPARGVTVTVEGRAALCYHLRNLLFKPPFAYIPPATPSHMGSG